MPDEFMLPDGPLSGSPSSLQGWNVAGQNGIVRNDANQVPHADHVARQAVALRSLVYYISLFSKLSIFIDLVRHAFQLSHIPTENVLVPPADIPARGAAA